MARDQGAAGHGTHRRQRLGYPPRAPGGRLLATPTREMARRDARYGPETMCIGGGQGLAALVERIRRAAPDGRDDDGPGILLGRVARPVTRGVRRLRAGPYDGRR